MIVLYKFHWDCGRMGDVEGVFIATEKDVQAIIGEEIYFGEILGKHSEIYGQIQVGEITELSRDQLFIDKAFEIFGGNTISGYNPFDYRDE